MGNINGGYVALVVVGIIFLGLQVWWLSMIVRNGNNKRGLSNQTGTEEIKKSLEKIFSKIN